MLAARYTLDFHWLYKEDPTKYDELYSLVQNAYASEQSILETAKSVVYDVIAKDNVRYSNDLEKEIDETEFLTWHVQNHLTVVQTILDYEKRSAEAVKQLYDITTGADMQLLTVEEYAKGLSDPQNHPLTMSMGDPIVNEKQILISNALSHRTARLNTLLAFIFGVVFIATILTLVVFIPKPTPIQYHFFAVVMALAAGGVATVMSGMIDVRAKLGKRLAIGATGALGVLVIVYFFLPAMTQN
jgi:VIT1/CCC1 family predicted Fe2+/Mn2+ transporter